MIILFLSLFSLALCDWYHSTLAFSLAANNFQLHIGKDQHVILDFFTPWCIYCQHMAGEFNRVYEHYQETRPDILIAKMNCDEQQNQHICHQFGVHSFPTILYFPPGQDRPTSQFQNHRRFEFFVQWIDSLAQISEETKLKLEQKERERQQQEQEEQQKRLDELLQQEKQRQIELEEQQQKQEEELKISQSIQQQIIDANKYIETIRDMEKEIKLLQQQTGELNTKVGQIKRQSKVNVDHALIFGMVGLLIGIALTSCICSFHKTNYNHVNNIEKAI